jgi:hypothetical protein
MLIELITFFRPARLVSLLLQPSFCCFEFRTEIQKRSELHYFSMCSPFIQNPQSVFSLKEIVFFNRKSSRKKK